MEKEQEQSHRVALESLGEQCTGELLTKQN